MNIPSNEGMTLTNNSNSSINLQKCNFVRLIMDNSAKRKKRKYLSCGNKITQPLSTLGKYTKKNLDSGMNIVQSKFRVITIFERIKN